MDSIAVYGKKTEALEVFSKLLDSFLDFKLDQNKTEFFEQFKISFPKLSTSDKDSYPIFAANIYLTALQSVTDYQCDDLWGFWNIAKPLYDKKAHPALTLDALEKILSLKKCPISLTDQLPFLRQKDSLQNIVSTNRNDAVKLNIDHLEEEIRSLPRAQNSKKSFLIVFSILLGIGIILFVWIKSKLKFKDHARINDYLNSIAHDLKSPLKSIIQRIESNEELSATQIAEELRNVQHKIQAYSDIYKIDEYDLKVKPTNLEELVEDVAQELEIEDYTFITKDFTHIDTDILLLRSAIINILENAKRFSHNLASHPIKIQFLNVGGSKKLSFINTGHTFPSDYKIQAGRIFHTNEQGSRSGIGLITVKKILAQLNGHLHINSAEQKTEVSIILNPNSTS